MNRKNIFSICAVLMAAFLCFCSASCSSGYKEEGEVAFTFTEPMMRKIFSREAGSGSEKGYDFSNITIPQIQGVKYYFAGFYTLNETINTVVLYVFDNYTYAVYDVQMLQSVLTNLSGNNGISGSDPYSIFDSAALSKGTWEQSSSSIIIYESSYYDSSSKNLITVEKPQKLGEISSSDKQFDIKSSSGVSFTFYSMNGSGNDYPNYDGKDNYNDYYDETPVIKVELKAGGRTYKQESEVVSVEVGMVGKLKTSSDAEPNIEVDDDELDAIYVMFAYTDGNFVIQKYKNEKFDSEIAKGTWKEQNNGIMVNVVGREKPMIIEMQNGEVQQFSFEDSKGNEILFTEADENDEFIQNFRYLPQTIHFTRLPLGARGKVSVKVTMGNYTVASGESDDFIIAETTNVNVKLHLAYSFEEDDPNHSGHNQGGYEENNTEYSGQYMLPEEYRGDFNGGWLYFSAYSDKSYKIIGNVYKDDNELPEDKLFAKGTWSLSESEGTEGVVKLVESDCYDFTTHTLKTSKNIQNSIDLAQTSFNYTGSNQVLLTMTLNPKSYQYNMEFVLSNIKDISTTDTRTIQLLAVTEDSLVNDISKLFVNDNVPAKDQISELLTSNTILSIYTMSLKEISSTSSHPGAPKLVVDNKGNLKITISNTYLTVKPGKTIGILALVYSGDYNKPEYEYAGFNNKVVLSSSSNSVSLSMSPIETNTVPSTKMAFYNYNYYSSTSNYEYYLTDDVLETKPATADLGIKLDYGPNREPCYFFDNDGKLYVLSCTYDNQKITKIVSTDSNNDYTISMPNSNEEIRSISFDRETNNVFVYSELNNDAYLYSCEKDSLSTMSTTAKKYKLSKDFSNTELSDFNLSSVKVFNVFNNILYIPYCYVADNSAYITIIMADLSTAVFDSTNSNYNLSLTDDNLQKYSLFNSMSSGYPLISDMIYQDENLYILISDIYINDSWTDNSDPFRSRGAVVKINLLQNQMDKIGWTDEELDVSSAGAYLKTSSNWDDFCYSDDSQTNLFVMDGTKPFDVYNTSVLISSNYPSIYVPKVDDDLSSDAFYGPQKFIAIKPKKLVISDDGFAFYTNEDGALSYRNVNRVVIVDLKKFAIETCSEVPVKFAGGASSDFNGDYSRTLERELNGISDNFYYSIQDDEIIYDKNGSNIENFTSDSRIAIKCSDADE